MNKLVKEETKTVWSEKLKECLDSYCVFYTKSHTYICGWPVSFEEDTDEPVAIADKDWMPEVKIKPESLLGIANCSVYSLKVGETNIGLTHTLIPQFDLIKTKTSYSFKDIDTKRFYAFENKDGFIVFLRCVKWDENRATFKLIVGFSALATKEYTAEEFAETFKDVEDIGCCCCFSLLALEDIIKTFEWEASKDEEE